MDKYGVKFIRLWGKNADIRDFFELALEMGLEMDFDEFKKRWGEAYNTHDLAISINEFVNLILKCV